MPAQDNKAIVRRLFEVYNTGNSAIVDDLVDTNYVHHDPVLHTPQGGPADLKNLVVQSHARYPDIQFAVEDQIGEADKVVTRWTARGTDLGGKRAKGALVSITGVDIARVAGGKIVETWANWDALGLQEAAEVVPHLAGVPL